MLRRKRRRHVGQFMLNPPPHQPPPPLPRGIASVIDIISPQIGMLNACRRHFYVLLSLIAGFSALSL